MAGSSKPPHGTKRPRSPRCHTCGAAIRVPAGWSPGPAVRRHYWRKHPEVMQPKGSKR